MAETPLKDTLRHDLNAARKERDRLRTTVLTTFLSEIRNREIELGREASDEDVQPLLVTAIKRRREAAEQMRAGGREELAAKEEQESAMLQGYLPPQLGESEEPGLRRRALFIVKRDGNVLRPVADGSGNLSIFHDGQTIAVSYQGAIWTVPAEGGTLTVMCGGEPGASPTTAGTSPRPNSGIAPTVPCA